MHCGNQELARTAYRRRLIIKFTFKLTLKMVYFTRLRVGFPDPPAPLEDKANSWKIYVTCQSTNYRWTDPLLDVRQMEDEDKLRARSALVGMMAKCNTGMPLNALYDEKVCHTAHEFSYAATSGKHDPVKVWRIRGSDIRIYFIYLPGKVVLILKISPKRTDTLDKAKKKQLETLAKAALNTIEKHTFAVRIIP